MRISGVILSLLLGTIICGCDSSLFGNDEGDTQDIELPFSNSAVGYINGKKWDFVSGRAQIDTSLSNDYIFIELWNQDFADPCNEPKGSEYQIHIKTLATVGQFEIRQDAFRLYPVIFFQAPRFAKDNASADIGFVAIDRIAQEVVGRFRGVFSNPLFQKTEANGRFRVPLCDEN